MVEFAAVMVPLSKALGLSVVVERVVEVAKHVVEPLRGNGGSSAIPDPAATRTEVENLLASRQREAEARVAEVDAAQRAPEHAARLADLQSARDRLLTETAPEKRTALLAQIAALTSNLSAVEAQGGWDEQVPTSVVLVRETTDPDDGWTLRGLILQLAGLAVGILCASFADLRLFSAFLDHASPGLAPWLDHVFTGLFIGGGSGPAHTLIEFVTARKQAARAVELAVAESAEEKAPPVRPAVAVADPDVAADAWVDIPYSGGVDLDVLAGVHRRDADPTLVVYHHTAMSSASTFEDVVRVIKSRGWLTGYHCVILADGSIHAFCRWDRYGNHALGYNLQSLGISFNGNFETDPAVPFSNPDGRYGAARPTEAQLRAGARVVALWTILYSIRPDFTNSIIPHRRIANKACPGSNFPYVEFEQLVTYYRRQWESPASLAQQRIAAFRLKPYLFHA